MRYQPHLDPAVKGMSFHIKRGEKIAIVGRTGAGKSSLFQLLQGFREPSKGSIKIGGVDVNNMTKQQLRKSVSVVHQNPYINTSENIRDNLLGY